MVKACEPPWSTVWAVLGVMDPWSPALGVIVNMSMANVALMVWSAVTLVKV